MYCYNSEAGFQFPHHHAGIPKTRKSKSSTKSTERASQHGTEQSKVDKCFQIPEEFEPNRNNDGLGNKNLNNEFTSTTPRPIEINTIIGTNAGGDMTVHGSLNVTIGLLSPPPAVPAPVIIKTFQMVETATPSFSGRDVLLQKIHARITDCATKANWYERVVVLHGLDGMGKSELARKYVHLHMDEPFIKNVAWIDAETESSLRASFLALAEKLGLSLSLSSPDGAHQHGTKKISQAIYEHFSNYIQKGLLIFDNAEQMNSLMKDDNFGLFEYLPTQNLEVTPLIILTSRDKEWDTIPMENIICVRELSHEAAVQLLEERLQLTEDQRHNDKDMAAVKRLSSALESFPLAIILSASNIPNMEWSDLEADTQGYLERMARKPKDDSKPNPDPHWMNDEHSSGSASKYNLIMSNVWSVTFEKIKSSGAEGEAALKLMNLMAYLPSHRITMDSLNAMFQFVFDAPNPPQAMSYFVLEKYSIISIRKEILKKGDTDADTEVYQILIHRLVQQCALKELDFENDHSYLVRLSDYMTSQKEIEPFLEELEQLHRYLRDRNWPGNSIEASILLLAHMINTDDGDVGLGQALNLLNDIAPFLQRTLKSAQSAVWLFPSFSVGTLFLELVHLVIFLFCAKFKDLTVSDKDPIFGQDKCREYVVTSLIPYVEHLVVSQQDLDLDAAHRLRDVICEKILYFKPELVNKEMKVDISKVILATHSSTTCERLDTTGDMMRLLWDYIKNSSNLILEYVTIVCQKHVEVYPNFTKQSSTERKTEEITKYWGNNGPLPTRDLLPGFHSVRSRIQEINNTAKSEEFTWDSQFQKSRCCGNFSGQRWMPDFKSSATLLQYTLSEIPRRATDLLKFMSYLGFHWNCADEFTRTEGFMDNLVQFLKTSLQPKKYDFVYAIRFWSLIIWLGIFSKTATISVGGSIWFINSMDVEVGEMYREMKWGIGLWEDSWLTEWWSERYIEILNEFLKNHTGGGVGVKSAKILITILNRKYLGLYQRKLTSWN